MDRKAGGKKSDDMAYKQAVAEFEAWRATVDHLDILTLDPIGVANLHDALGGRIVAEPQGPQALFVLGTHQSA